MPSEHAPRNVPVVFATAARGRVASWRAYIAAHSMGIWLAAITLVGAYGRLCFLDAPIRYDEAFTFLRFVKGGPPQLFEYPYPNNHILHTLLVRASTDVFGRELASIRLPAWVFGVAAIPLTSRLCRRLGSGASGYLAASGVAAWPYLVLYSAIARGYSLMLVLALGVALLGLEIVKAPSWRRCALLALLAALGMLTMPSMLFALAGLGIWLASLVLARQRKWRVAVYLGACAALTAALTLLFYTPTLIVSGASAILSNRFVAPLPWHEFTTKLGPHLSETMSHFARDVPLAVLVVGLVLALTGIIGAFVSRNWAAFMLAPSLVLGGGAVLALKHSIPYARTWIYMLPFALVLADMGLGYLLRPMAAAYRPAIPLALLASSAVACSQIVSRDLLARYPDVGAFPQASALVQRLKPHMHRGESVHVRNPGSFPVRFYLWYYGVPEPHRKPRRPRQEFIVSRKGIDTVPDGDPTLVFEHEGLAVYRRTHRPKRAK